MCAMLEIERNTRLKELGWRLLLQVHLLFVQNNAFCLTTLHLKRRANHYRVFFDVNEKEVNGQQ
jgi:hypothetical protein